MRLLLASESLTAVFAALARWRAGRGAVLIGAAAERLDDGTAIVASYRATLAAHGFEVTQVDLAPGSDPTEAEAAVRRAAVVFVGGGDPFHLLARCRATGADRWVCDTVGRGVPYVGVSAGAMVAGPDLAPARLTSPFRPPSGLDLTALGLTEQLVLPHHDRPGRAALHASAQAAYPSHALVPLTDREVLSIDGPQCEVLSEDGCARLPDHPDVRFRAATRSDAEDVAAVFTSAARAAWAGFLGIERLAIFRSPAELWRTRIAAATPPAAFRIATDAAGVVGFAAIRRGSDADVSPQTGELDFFYTHPRAWGRGLGRGLERWARATLAGEGFTDAVLWTESRNERPLRVYAAAGWRPDGANRERDYLGVPIREIRLRIRLA